VARSLIRNIQPRDVKKLFGNLSQTNYYQVDFSSLSTFGPNQELITYLGERGVDKDFISRDAGLLCSEASLPGTSLATAEVKDNFMGISQEFAHTRLYTDFDFTFYVDTDYKSIKFFEGWIDFISSGSETLSPIGDGANPLNSNYYRRMRYPDTYKCQTMTITKFERNVSSTNTIKYSFINVFPKTISTIPISYGGADILKVSVSFNYDRYAIDISGFSKGQQGKFTDVTQSSAEQSEAYKNRLNSLSTNSQTVRQSQTKSTSTGLVKSTPVNNLTPTARGLQEVAETGGGVSRQYAIDRLVKSRGMSYRDAAIEVKKIYGD